MKTNVLTIIMLLSAIVVFAIRYSDSRLSSQQNHNNLSRLEVERTATQNNDRRLDPRRRRRRQVERTATQNNDPHQQYLLSLMKPGIQLRSNDEKKAFESYQKAAELGNAAAMYNLGVCYKNGTGVTKDEKKAFEWYQKAAELGEADAMYNLGVCYDNGTGVTKDEKKAFESYQKAAELGDAAAMHNLGVCYYNGTGVTKDEKKAAEWFQKAADVGN